MPMPSNFQKTAIAVSKDTVAITTVVTGALMLSSLIERNSLWAAINPTCHMIDGDDKLYGDNFDKRDTLLGLALIKSAMAFWVVLYRLFNRSTRAPKSFLTGSLMAAFAYIVDYYIVPKRYTPGFEQKLSGKAMFFTYCALALAIATRPAID
jgi:hypothetical protein